MTSQAPDGKRSAPAPATAQNRPAQSQRLGASDSELCGRPPERRRAGAINEARKHAARNRHRTATCRGVPRFRAPQLDTGLGRTLPRSGAASRWRGARCARRDVAPPARPETPRRRKGRGGVGAGAQALRQHVELPRHARARRGGGGAGWGAAVGRERTEEGRRAAALRAVGMAGVGGWGIAPPRL